MAHLSRFARAMSVQNRCCVIKYDLMERSGSFALLASTQRLASTLAPGTARLAEANTSARSFANKAKGDGYQGSSKSKEELQTDESRQYSGSNAQIDKKDVDSYPDKLKSSHKVSSNEESNTDTESSSDGKSRSAKSKEKEASLPTYS